MAGLTRIKGQGRYPYGYRPCRHSASRQKPCVASVGTDGSQHSTRDYEPATDGTEEAWAEL